MNILCIFNKKVKNMWEKFVGIYQTGATICFLVALFADDEDIFTALFIAFAWPAYAYKKIKKMIK